MKIIELEKSSNQTFMIRDELHTSDPEEFKSIDDFHETFNALHAQQFKLKKGSQFLLSRELHIQKLNEDTWYKAKLMLGSKERSFQRFEIVNSSALNLYFLSVEEKTRDNWSKAELLVKIFRGMLYKDRDIFKRRMAEIQKVSMISFNRNVEDYGGIENYLFCADEVTLNRLLEDFFYNARFAWNKNM